MEKDGRSFRAACAIFFTAVLIFGYFTRFLPFFVNFLAFLLTFEQFWAFFGHILCANFIRIKVLECYFVSFFHLCICLICQRSSKDQHLSFSREELKLWQRLVKKTQSVSRPSNKNFMVGGIKMKIVLQTTRSNFNPVVCQFVSPSIRLTNSPLGSKSPSVADEGYRPPQELKSWIQLGTLVTPPSLP